MKKVLGYTFSDRTDTQLTLSVLNIAVRHGQPGHSLIFHSDRASSILLPLFGTG